MTLVVNLVRLVSSGKFICCCWRNPWCDYHVTHTPKCNESAKIGQIIDYGLTTLIVSVFQCCLRITTELRSGAVDKMAGIFAEFGKPCICQPNEPKREIKKKTGGPSKKLGGHGPPRPPLRIATASVNYNTDGLRLVGFSHWWVCSHDATSCFIACDDTWFRVEHVWAYTPLD